MKKNILLLILVLFVFSCAHSKACKQLKEYLFKDKSCEFGYSIPGITGHPPECLTEKQYNEIKEECWNF